MRVTVRIAQHLRSYTRHELCDDGQFEMTLSDGAKIDDLITQLDFSPQVEVVVLANDVCCVDRDRALEDGDTIELLPLLAGG